MTTWLYEALTASPPGRELREHDGESIPIGRMAIEFLDHGAPIGEQRQTACAVARNYWRAGSTVEDTADALWEGLQFNNDPTKKPWTYQDAYDIAESIFSSEPTPIRPLEQVTTTNGHGPAREPIEGNERFRPRAFEAFSVDEWVNMPDDPADVIIGDGGGGFVMDAEGKLAVAGPTGVGKTNLTLRLGRALAEGSSFLGLPVPQPRRVLHLALEGSKRTYRRRLAKVWADASPEAAGRYHLARLQVNVVTELDGLDEMLRRYQPEVLIIDPLRNAHALDENDSRQVAELTSVLDGLIDRHGCALIFNHHSRKASPFARKGDEGIDGVRGSTAFTGWLTACVNISRKPKTPDTLLLDWVKTRDTEEALPALELDFQRATINYTFSARSEEVDLEDLILNAVFHNVTIKKADLVATICQQTGAGVQKVQGLAVQMAKDGKLAPFVAPEDRKSGAITYRLPEEQNALIEEAE